MILWETAIFQIIREKKILSIWKTRVTSISIEDLIKISFKKNHNSKHINISTFTESYIEISQIRYNH